MAKLFQKFKQHHNLFLEKFLNLFSKLEFRTVFPIVSEPQRIIFPKLSIEILIAFDYPLRNVQGFLKCKPISNKMQDK
jgi:hypothetical protein